jgi:hypothetical protein
MTVDVGAPRSVAPLVSGRAAASKGCDTSFPEATSTAAATCE